MLVSRHAVNYIHFFLFSKGVSRIFAFAGDRFYLMKAMNDQEGEKKVLASSVGVARLGDFCAVALESENFQFPVTNCVQLFVFEISHYSKFKFDKNCFLTRFFILLLFS